MTSSKRALAALALGALALPVLAPAAVAAAPPPARSLGEFCAGVVGAGFTDVAADNAFRDAIDCIAAAAVTTGLRGGTEYGPTLPVSRGQMASFIARMLETADELDTGQNVRALPAYDGTNEFTDVASDDVHVAAINRLAEAGIVLGGPGGLAPTQYGPSLNVSRAQMASFIIRALRFATGAALETAEDYFADDEDAAPHEDSINAVASLAIAQGTGASTYAPTGAVSRGQMAAFIARSLAYLESVRAVGPLVPATTNQSFTVRPADAATLTLGGDDAASRTRTYSVSTPAAGATHQIQLVPATYVSIGTDGTVTFADDDDDDRADVGAVAARITSVNNVAVAATTRAQATPIGSTITFTVEGLGVESVVPVVFFDADADGFLDLDDAGAPLEAEPFGVGGATTFQNPAAEDQPLEPTDVQRVDRSANQFDANGVTFTYDDNDAFFVASASAPTAFSQVTLAQFEAVLSRGDLVSAEYSATPGAVSRFLLVDASPVAPTTVRAEAGTGEDSRDITVTVAISGIVDTVVLQRAPVTGGTDEADDGTVGTWATIATLTPTQAQLTAGAVVHVDEDVALGVYRYRAAVLADGQQTAFTVDATNEASADPVADTTRPLATTTTLITDGGLAGILDQGDVFTVRADEVLAAPSDGAFLRVQDIFDQSTNPVTSVADVVCGTNATCTLNPAAVPDDAATNAGAAAGTVLTVTLTADPTVVTPGILAGVSLPALLVNTSGITDVAGNRITLTGTGTDNLIG